METPDFETPIPAPALPESVLQIVDRYQADGISASDCVGCSSPCCAHGGFAILENVEAIYERYSAGNLNRTDYEFPPGMSFRDFVLEYFDLYRFEVPNTDDAILFFHMRSLSPSEHTISIPPMADVYGYYRAREAFFSANQWMNKGCVFLSHRLDTYPMDDGVAARHCILHTAEASERITAKPIDCVFHTCNTPGDARQPTNEQTQEWFAELARRWPNSVDRFRQLVEADSQSP